MNHNVNPYVTVVLVNRNWHWAKLHTVHPGSVRLSAESFPLQFDAERAAAHVALWSDLTLRLPHDDNGQWAMYHLNYIVDTDNRIDATYRRMGAG